MRSSGNSSDDSDVAFPSFSSAPTSIGPGAVTKYKPRTDHHRSRHHRKRHGSSSSRKSRRRHDDDRQLHRLERSRKEQKRARIEAPASEQKQHEIWQQLVEDRLLSVDTSGDANLRLFQQSSGPGAPRFTRRGIRLVLGQGRRLRIESSRKDSPDIRLVEPINVSVRYTDVDWTLHDRETERIVRQEHDAQMLQLQEGFVPIEAEVGRGSTGAMSKYDSDDGSGKNPDFRSLEGMLRVNPTTTVRNSHVNDEDEISANATLGDDRIHSTTAVLESRISANKHDIEAWLQLIAHQEAIVQASFGGKDVRHKSRTKRAIAEVQIEMYRRALRSNPSSQKLLLGYLSQCAETMDDDTLIIEWESAAESTSDPHIILCHVRFCQSLASRFSVPWMVDIYTVSIRRIVRCGIRDKANREASEIGIAVMELIHSVCLFFREAGFWEHALALYQAAVEWYVMTLPEKRRLSVSHRIQAFREFWDSGRPRVGANAACGWCNNNADDTCEDAGILEVSELDAANSTDNDNLHVPDKTSTLFDLWYHAEIGQSRSAVEAHGISANELSEEQLQSMDPFSIVVFEDVEPFLVDLTWSQVAAETLVDGFLQFLGVVGPYSFTLTHTYRTQQSLARSELTWTVPWFGEELLRTVDVLSRHSQSADKQNKSIIPPPFVVVPLGLDTPDTPLPYSHTCPWHRPTNTVYQRVAGNALFQLQKLSPLSQRSRLQLSTALVEYAFASESPEYGKNVSRELLAQHPTCLALWNSFAKMQARNNMWDEARRIWARAICLADTLPVVEQPWIVVLCKSWAVLEILHGRGLAIGIKIIAAIASKNVEHMLELAAGNSHSQAEDVQSADLLAAQRIIAEYTQECEANSNEELNEINHAISTLRIWVAYAGSGSDGAQQTADALSRENAAADNEHLAMAICTVHLFHAKTSRVYRAADLRTHVQRSLQAFPHNSVFWEMLLFSEQRACIANRVNRQLTNVLLAHPDGELPDVLLLRAFIAASKCRNDEAANTNTVRWALRRATREGVGISLLVWAASIAFECQQESFKRAKRLLLSALRKCPWAKVLYMAALGGSKLALAFSESEKQALLRAMVRAGIRTHSSLAEM
ncbi:DUF1740-domain-containing protein [Coemansia reversa NRRL 1564]|uniref:DUF1740-domain-containing protein n=1 Tax=Coemansia reversa (strain ATCC 12441 / NRRL 1564) TaxID=763665 RepID=A0A2G5B5Q1_COERN|nr:DUF1740-domain-containing protein [Coemansia reversa NRRL 1564]|eukprot:PIA14336.1 DUF1740-domain-containing protein [Coemansia reversa NRRL 1564]